MSVEIIQPFRVFGDVDGDPLEDGFIRIGAANQDPLVSPISVFWDSDLTIPAVQPIRTIGGYPSRSGAPSRMYVSADAYSILVSNKNGTTIHLGLDTPAGDSALRVDLANGTNPAKGAGLVGYKGRTVAGRLSERMSVRDFITTAIDGVTSNQAGIEAAVSAALAAGASLHWSAGTYVSTANIPNLHSVQHTGEGVIKRGASTFKVAQRGAQTNTLFLGGVGGSATNDGLTADVPFNNWNTSFAALDNYGPIIPGIWIVEVAAGTYSVSAGQHTFSTASKNRIVFRGPDVGGHPNVPTAVVSGGFSGADYAHGLAFDGPAFATLQDIKFVGYSGDPSAGTRGALLFDNGADGYIKNVHVDGSSWFGVYWSRRSQGRQEGGIINACRNGVNTDGAKCTVGYNSTTLAQGTVVSNCTESGIYWARGTDGHIDFCKIEDNAVGVFVDSNSRVDSISNNFKRNTIAVRTSSSGIFGDNPNAPSEFNIGTADANTQADIEFRGISGESTELAAATSPLRVAYDRITRTASGIGTVLLTTPFTIRPGRLRGVGKSCKVVVHGVYTVTAGSGVIVTFGGLSLTLSVPGAATGAVFKAEVELFDVSGGYRALGMLSQNLTAPRMGSATSGFVNTDSSPITISSVLTGAGDTISIYRTDIFING